MFSSVWVLFLRVLRRKYGLAIASFRHYFAVGKNRELLINTVDIHSGWSNKEWRERKAMQWNNVRKTQRKVGKVKKGIGVPFLWYFWDFFFKPIDNINEEPSSFFMLLRTLTWMNEVRLQLFLHDPAPSWSRNLCSSAQSFVQAASDFHKAVGDPGPGWQ